MNADVRDLVEATTWHDTHEHLIEESTRLGPPAMRSGLHPTEGWAYLLWHYALDDLMSAGLSPEDRDIFLHPDAGSIEKWDAIAGAYERARHSTYLVAARHTIRELYGLDLRRDTVAEIDARMARLRRPGFYRDVLATAGVRTCQVNSLEATFCETAQPDQLLQDIGLTSFLSPDQGKFVEWQAATGLEIRSLVDLLMVVDTYFERHGPAAVATKLGMAYTRSLRVQADPPSAPLRVFRRWLSGDEVAPKDRTAIEDAIVHRGLSRAADLRLPVKVHTGLHVGNDRMDLGSVRDNVADVTRLAMRYPSTFVLMHIGYPYEGEVIAAVKHVTNVVADMCWAWIIDPVASSQFLKRFLTTAPASKVLCFGGDYIPIENVVGHARVARSGLARTLEDLCRDGYLADHEARSLVPKLMRGNAERIFGRSGGPVMSGPEVSA